MKRSQTAAGAALLVYLSVVVVLLSGVAGSSAKLGRLDASVAKARAFRFRFFSPSSFWNTRPPSDAPVDPNSASLVNALASEVSKEIADRVGPWISTVRFSVPIYRVPAAEPTVPVALVGHPHDSTLRAAWRAVPLPPNAHPAAGSDGHLVVWQPHTDRLWEFWRLERTSTGWQASWGGAMRHVSSDPGVYNRSVWPGSKPWWGASASSLSIAGGLITFEDLKSPEINHALAIALPEIRQGVFASPAKRTDGKSSNPLALPEGAHLQLDPNIDLTALNLPPLTLKIARAATHYGIFVRDGAKYVTFYAQDPTPTGTEPYKGPYGYFEGEDPIQLLSSFPWQDLRVLKMDPHTKGAPSAGRAQAGSP